MQSAAARMRKPSVSRSLTLFLSLSRDFQREIMHCPAVSSSSPAPLVMMLGEPVVVLAALPLRLLLTLVPFSDDFSRRTAVEVIVPEKITTILKETNKKEVGRALIILSLLQLGVLPTYVSSEEHMTGGQLPRRCQEVILFLVK